MEGKGFEPTVEALFGANGFFPDTMLKTMYYVSDNMPQRFSEILKKLMPGLTRDRVNTQVHVHSNVFSNSDPKKALKPLWSQSLYACLCFSLPELHEGPWTKC